MGCRKSSFGIKLTYRSVFFRNHTYVKLLVVQNVIPIQVPCANTLRRFMELISMPINGIKAMETAITAVVEEVVVAVEVVATDRVPTTRHRIGAMRCR